MQRYEQLLLENKAWAKERLEADPQFFKRHAQLQRPDVLWIGCSDSRVHPEQITQAQPGEIFIHRNVANVVREDDNNLMSVLQYGVEVLGIKHVIVCGHYGCGGVIAAMNDQEPPGTIGEWIRPIRNLHTSRRAEVEAIRDEELRVQRMVELNVIEQVQSLARTDIVRRAWKEGPRPYLHGWVYNIHNGIITPVVEIDASNAAAAAAA